VVELQESQGRMGAVIDSMQDGLVVYDQDHRVARVNAFMLSLFHLEADELSGRTFEEVARLTGEPPLDETRYIGHASGDSIGIIFEIDGARQRFIRRMVSPVVAEDVPPMGIVALYQDITDQKEVEQLKDDFLSIASHELKTPLTSIMGYT